MRKIHVSVDIQASERKSGSLFFDCLSEGKRGKRGILQCASRKEGGGKPPKQDEGPKLAASASPIVAA